MAKSTKHKPTRKRTRKAAPQVPPKPQIPERLKKYAASIDLPKMRKASRLLSLLFCDFVNNTEDGKVNLLGIFDRVVVHPERKESPSFVVYGRTAETIDDVLWVTVFGPNDAPAMELRLDPPPPREAGRVKGKDIEYPKQVQFFFPVKMVFHKEGTYWFDISYKGSSLGGAGLVIEFTDTGGKQGGTNTFI